MSIELNNLPIVNVIGDNTWKNKEIIVGSCTFVNRPAFPKVKYTNFENEMNW